MAEDTNDAAGIAGGTVVGAASGAAAGTAVLPGWGTLAGAIIGGATSLIGGLMNSDANRRKALYMQQQIDDIEASGKTRIDAIQTVFANAGKSMTAALQSNVELVLDEVEADFTKAFQSLEKQQKEAGDYYTEAGKARREAFKKSQDNLEASMNDNRQLIKNTFTAERMGVSGAFTEAIHKSEQMQLEKQKEMNADELMYEQEITKQFAKALDSIAQQKANTVAESGRRVSEISKSAANVLTDQLAKLSLSQAGMEDNVRQQTDQSVLALKMGKTQAEAGANYDAGQAFADLGIGALKGGGEQLVKDLGSKAGNKNPLQSIFDLFTPAKPAATTSTPATAVPAAATPQPDMSLIDTNFWMNPDPKTSYVPSGSLDLNYPNDKKGSDLRQRVAGYNAVNDKY